MVETGFKPVSTSALRNIIVIGIFQKPNLLRNENISFNRHVSKQGRPNTGYIRPRAYKGYSQ